MLPNSQSTYSITSSTCIIRSSIKRIDTVPIKHLGSTTPNRAIFIRQACEIDYSIMLSIEPCIRTSTENLFSIRIPVEKVRAHIVRLISSAPLGEKFLITTPERRGCLNAIFDDFLQVSITRYFSISCSDTYKTSTQSGSCKKSLKVFIQKKEVVLACRWGI